MSASPFATLNGELPPAARVAIDAARAVAEAAQSAYEQNRAETASVRAEIVAISAAVATAETTAEIESKLATREALTKLPGGLKKALKDLLSRLSSYVGPKADVQAYKLILAETPRHFEERDRREAELLEQAHNAAAAYCVVCHEVWCGVVNSELDRLAPILERQGFPPIPPKFAERVGPALLPPIDGRLHVIVKDISDAQLTLASWPHLREQSVTRLRELGFTVDGA